MEEKDHVEYVHCYRCETEINLVNGIEQNYVEYKNGLLCFRCNHIRLFDDDNPILYPVAKP